MRSLRDAMVEQGLVPRDDAQRAEHASDARAARRRARRHERLASRERDAEMSEIDIADEILRAARR